MWSLCNEILGDNNIGKTFKEFGDPIEMANMYLSVLSVIPDLMAKLKYKQCRLAIILINVLKTCVAQCDLQK